jgi:hypothetical protein
MTSQEIERGNRMTRTEIGLGNKLIREFMNPDCYKMPRAKPYNSSWDLLMLVVEKIEATQDDYHGYFAVIISSNGCVIQGTKLRTDPENYHPAYFNQVYGETKLKATYAAVLQFLEWYNSH